MSLSREREGTRPEALKSAAESRGAGISETDGAERIEPGLDERDGKSRLLKVSSSCELFSPVFSRLDGIVAGGGISEDKDLE